MGKKLYLCILISVIIAIIMSGCGHNKHSHYDDEEDDDIEIVKSHNKETSTNSPEEKLSEKESLDESVSSSETLNLSGDMAGFPITLDLRIKDGRVTGKYYNVKYKASYNVKGKVSEGMYDLTLSAGKDVVYMTLYSSGANTFIGEATGGGKTLSVNLTRK